MSVSTQDIERILQQSGFQKTSETKKFIQYTNLTTNVALYITKAITEQGVSLVIDPDTDDSTIKKILRIQGISRPKDYLYNSNMRAFPPYIKQGKKPIPRGILFRFESKMTLQNFVGILHEKL